MKLYKKEDINDEFIIKMYIRENNKISINNIRQSFMKNHPEIEEYLRNRFYPFINYITVIRCIQNKMDSPPKCKICGKYVSFGMTYCSSNCKNSDKEMNKKRGEKISKTKLNWSEEKKEEVYNKVKTTRLNWSEEKKEEFSKKMSNLGEESLFKRKENYRKTCLTKYQVEAYTQSNDFKDKCKKTYNQKFNVNSYVQTNEFKEKSKETRFKNTGYYESGYANPVINQKVKNTLINNYGVDNPMKSPEIIKKVQETCLKHYGVRSYSQTKEFKDKISLLRYEYNSEYFDSSWELAFYIYHKDNNISILREPFSIDYIFNNKSYKYFPDFLINNNQLVEIKNPQCFTNDGKMIDLRNPQNNDKCEAKHQCMIKNKVLILTNVDFYLKYVKNTYGAKYLNQFKRYEQKEDS